MKRSSILTFVQAAAQVEVTFNKIIDGSKRVLIGTLNMDMIPNDQTPESSEGQEADTQVVNIYDLEKNDWRSFNISTVTNLVGMTADGEVVTIETAFE